jgi:GDPmannose 4,6-dehydratase
MTNSSGVAIVIGASGQDGSFLTERLLAEGSTVYALTRRPEVLRNLIRRESVGQLKIQTCDLLDQVGLLKLIAGIQPSEIYNLAGQSSVSKSFSDPLYTWRTNTEIVIGLLEAIRLRSPLTRFYQASSTDMFGSLQEGVVSHDENSVLNPESPYASAKAAAHLLCRSYREVYNLRVACGILSNHESHRRPAHFLSRKIVDHVRLLQSLSPNEAYRFPPLTMGNLFIQRDWGFAPDYVEGMCKVLRQISVRARCQGSDGEPDEGAFYRDYVLSTGQTHAVWQLVERAFALAGFNLDWQLREGEPQLSCAYFRVTGSPAVVVDPELLRPSDPLFIKADPALARKELGWSPQQGLDVFLSDMLTADPVPVEKIYS